MERSERDERTALLTSLLTTALRVRANELDIAPSMIANRNQLEDLVAWYLSGRHEFSPDIVLPSGWKYSVAGQMLLSFLDGNYSLCARPEAPYGVALVPFSPGGEAWTSPDQMDLTHDAPE